MDNKGLKRFFLLWGLVFSLFVSGCSLTVNTGLPENDPEAVYTPWQSPEETSSLEEDSENAPEKPYKILNKNQPEFSNRQKKSKKAFEKYSRLDSLGRCGVAFANICKKLMPKEKRGEIGTVKPSGWHTVKYDIVDGKYLYNRCHLIGYQLAGENANEKNLITGTRYLNVEGMLPFENKIADYVEKTNHHVLYRVTPVFEGKNLLADGVQMEAYSVEDQGKGICFNVFAYNIQPGIRIDYADGGSKLIKKIKKNQADTASGKKKSSDSGEKEQDYILNKNTKKFHDPDCSSVKETVARNRKKYHGKRSTLIKQGYSPCGRCNP